MKASATTQISGQYINWPKAGTTTKQMKEHKMKIGKIIGTTIAMAVALAFATGCATNSSTGAQMRPMKAGEHMLMLNQIETKEQADALKPDDSIAMVCAKCKTVYTTRVKQGVKGAQLLNEGGHLKELIGTHACSGCNSTLVVTGQRIDKREVLKHSCGSCGDDSAFCCATKSTSGPTKGM